MNVEGVVKDWREACYKEGKKNMRKLRETEEKDGEQEKVGQQVSDSCVKGMGL